VLKILLLAAVLFAVYYFFFRTKPIKEVKRPHVTPETMDDMVPCAKCGTYVTLDDAYISGGRYFCSTHCIGA